MSSSKLPLPKLVGHGWFGVVYMCHFLKIAKTSGKDGLKENMGVMEIG